MNILIVLAHPERKSFNGALVATAIEALEKEDHQVRINNLNAEKFDPVGRAEWYPEQNNSDFFAPLTEQSKHFKANRLPADVNRETSRHDVLTCPSSTIVGYC